MPDRCADCNGVVAQSTHCLAHLTGSEWHAEIERLRRGAGLDARDVAISSELLAALLADLGEDAGGRAAVFSGAASFAGATFHGSADFEGARFCGLATFAEAQFSGDAFFDGTHFGGGAAFDRARFAGIANLGARFVGAASFVETRFANHALFLGAHFCRDAEGAESSGGGISADFSGAQFSRYASFPRVHFRGDAEFHHAQFSDDAGFEGAWFGAGARFGGARFAAAAGFDEARIDGGVSFGDAQIAGGASFVDVHVAGDAYFGGARFKGDAQLGPMVVAGTLDCDGAVFETDARFQLSAAGLSCRGARFVGRAELDVRWADVVLDDAAFVGRARLVGVGPFGELNERALPDDHSNRVGGDRARPRLFSLRRAGVETLTLGRVDLRACRFYGAHGLDELRIEADCNFASSPGWWRTGRRTLAEEHDWRARRHGQEAIAGSAWCPRECQPSRRLEGCSAIAVLDPPRIASLYRALRKALEDRKDEPGAGDFYYGEMEMRRQPSPGTHRLARAARERGERAILTLYWLVSGYGMRASRALAFLALTIAAGAVLFANGGFRDGPPTGGAAAFALESAISLLRAPIASLTGQGEFTEIALRLLGPLFVGLALLALRGRVKR